MVGASLMHARRFVYADGIDVDAPAIAVPVGITCRQCPRDDCSERAHERVEIAAAASATHDTAHGRL